VKGIEERGVRMNMVLVMLHIAVLMTLVLAYGRE
jgi:hypothetical protein